MFCSVVRTFRIPSGVHCTRHRRVISSRIVCENWQVTKLSEYTSTCMSNFMSAFMSIYMFTYMSTFKSNLTASPSICLSSRLLACLSSRVGKKDFLQQSLWYSWGEIQGTILDIWLNYQAMKKPIKKKNTQTYLPLLSIAAKLNLALLRISWGKHDLD